MINQQKWGITFAASGAIILLYLLSPILLPFFIAALFAYLGNPLVTRCVKWHIPRTVAVSSVFIFMILTTVLLLGLLVPVLQAQIGIFIARIPGLIHWFQIYMSPWLQNHLEMSGMLNIETLKNTLMGNWQQAGNIANKILRTMTHSGIALMTLAINFILIPVITFYFLRDWPRLCAQLKVLMPRRLLPRITHLMQECDEVLSAFFRGQLLVISVLALFYSLGLTLIGLDVAILIGVGVAIFSIVPYVGVFVGLVSAMLAALVQFHDLSHVVYVLILFIVGHLIEGMFLTPHLIGDRIGLHPVAVIFAVLAGGQLFGFLGILMALPIAAVIMVIMRYLYQRYLSSQFYYRQ